MFNINRNIYTILIFFLLLIIFLHCDSEKPTEIQQEIKYLPNTPLPLNGETIFSDELILSWKCDKENNFDVYLGSNIYTNIVKIDSNISEATYTINNLLPDKRYYWQILVKYNDTDSAFGPIWSFYTRSNTLLIFNPLPKDNARRLDLEQNLSWNMFSYPSAEINFDVYFDTLPEPGIVSINQSYNSYNPGWLRFNQKYYWKVDAYNNKGDTTRGPIWSFSTYPKSTFIYLPVPEEYASFVQLDQILSWRVSTNLGDQLRYDVYLDTLNEPELVSTNQIDKFYDPGGLLYDKIYYWKINAFNDKGDTAFGGIWQFRAELSYPIYAVLEATQEVYPVNTHRERFRARFDSVYSPTEPINPLSPSSILVQSLYKLIPVNSLVWFGCYLYQWITDYDEKIHFSVSSSYEVPYLSVSSKYPICSPTITKPELFGTLLTSGFEVQWEGNCTDSAIIEFRDVYYNASFKITTINDGIHFITADDLSIFDNILEDWFDLSVTFEKEQNIIGYGYDPRSVIKARTQHTITIIKFVDP